MGSAHTKNYQVEDPDLFYIVPAKALAMTVIDLLYGEAEEALAIKRDYPSVLSKEEYLKQWEEFCTGG